MDCKQKLADLLIKQRDILCLTAGEASIRLGVTRNAYLAWEDGLCLPALVRVQTIAEYLGYNYGSELIAFLENKH